MAAAEMGEVDDIHTNEENIKDGVSVNGDITVSKDMEDDNTNGSNDDVIHINSEDKEQEEEEEEEEEGIAVNENSDIDDNEGSVQIEDKECTVVEDEEEQVVETIDEDDEDRVEEEDEDEMEEEEEEEERERSQDRDIDKMSVEEIVQDSEGEQIHEIDNSDGDDDDDDDDDDVQISEDNIIDISNGVNSSSSVKNRNEGIVTINDSGEDVVMVDDNNKDAVVEVLDDKDHIENGGSVDSGDDLEISEATSTNFEDGEVISIDDTPSKKNYKKKEKVVDTGPPRRSSRNLNREKKSYMEDEYEEKQEKQLTPNQKLQQLQLQLHQQDDDDNSSEGSDIEEVMPQDPLAVADADPSSPASLQSEKSVTKKPRVSSSTIVVKDTKCLAEIASKSTAATNNNNNKKEPTLVIIDTNSILSGRGPVPIAQKPTISTPTITNTFSMLPMALPAQGIYPANMRATITPIPMTPSAPPPKPAPVAPTPQPVLPTLTDDMFVVEAPSFIVPYVYEKPPIKDLKEFIKNLETEINEEKKKAEEDKEKESEDKDKQDDKTEEDEKMDVDKEKEKTTNESDETTNDKESEKENKKEDAEAKATESDLPAMPVPTATTLAAELRKPPATYFDSPLGKFFMGIGYSLVQEHVQSDLLKQQKRRRDREGGQNPVTTKSINSLQKNLEFTKENNEPYRMETKKCEFCSFKTESTLAMAYHLETPHMKNYVYRCNFCSYEVRSPHDILFHMEVQHGVRGRLERAPAFHQCPNCPFEDNQKGKLSRHLVACSRKFKPERNLEPPADYEPPAKIPRAPRMKQQSLGSAAAVYHAMARTSQYQIMSKLPTSISAIQRGRGRPSLGTPPIKQPGGVRPVAPANMLYKQASMSGGSVLVPTNYQLSGNQLYQVVGGHELGGCLGAGGAAAFLPSIPASPNSLAVQQQQQQQTPLSKMKPVQQPSISITPLPRGTTATGVTITKPGDSNPKNSFVICEICDGYIKDLEQLRNHMQWIHKVKIHPKMIYNRPPLNCQKCQFRFFTDQGLERHLLGSHGLVTSSMQEAANRSKDAGRCPVCGRVYQWKLLNHVARDHNMTLKPAHLSYKCTVCTATFGMYKQFESHVYSAHSVVAKRVMDKKSANSASSSSKNESVLKPLKINDEITIIPQPAKPSNGSNNGGISDRNEPSSSSSPSNRTDRVSRRKPISQTDN